MQGKGCTCTVNQAVSIRSAVNGMDGTDGIDAYSADDRLEVVVGCR